MHINWKAKMDSRRAYEVLAIIAVVMLMLGVQKTWAGLHDVDNAWNMATLNCDYENLKSQVVDVRTDGTVIGQIGAYLGGFVKISYGSTASVIAAIFVGYFIGRRKYAS